jgi:hypothetical protein
MSVEAPEKTPASDRDGQVGETNRANGNRHAVRWLLMRKGSRCSYDHEGDGLNSPQPLAERPRVTRAGELPLVPQPLNLPRQQRGGSGGDEDDSKCNRISDLKPGFLRNQDAAERRDDDERGKNTADTLG